MIQRPVSFVNVRDKAKEFMEHELQHLSRREQERRKLITRLDDKALAEMLAEYRAHYYCAEERPLGQATFDSRVESILQTKLRDRYPELSPEEVQLCKDFIKNFVFVGDQFLYVRVASD